MSERLDLPNVQGLVVRGYRLPFSAFLFARIDDAARARTWLAGVLDDVLTATPWSEKPETGVNLALSYAGLQALGLPSASLAGFPQEFRAGMAARAATLGDIGPSAPEQWEPGFTSPGVHLLVMLSAKTEPALNAHATRLRAAMRDGMTIVVEHSGAALPGQTEHFGFADGFAQPSIEGAGLRALPGQGAADKGESWRPVRPGEFVLGYADEQGALPAAPAPDQLAVNGSYLVYRKLHQDVPAFRRQLTAAAARFDGGEELLAAKLVGRWRDGTPLAVSPDRPDPGLVADAERNNAFSYAEDPDGRRCPVGSHIRRVNPRRSLPFDGALVNRHRIVRRGIPYGPPLPARADDDGEDRGVLFLCLQASIARQFEFVQSQWIGDGNALRIGDEQDAIVGPQDQDGIRKMTIPGAPGSPPHFMGPLSRVVTVRGGEYFFCPGINGLRYLAALGGY